MELGGNAKAKEYYEKNGMMRDGKPDHHSPLLGKYKTAIKNEAAKLCGVEVPKEVPYVNKLEMKQENMIAKEEKIKPKTEDPLANIVEEE